MNFVRQSYLSVTDFEFYRTVLQQPLRKSLWYFFSWVTLAALFTAVVFLIRFYPRLDDVGDWLIQNLPAMEVRGGRLTAVVPTPYRISRDDLDFRIVVDPSNSVRRAVRNQGMEVIFNSDRIYVQFQGREDAYTFGKNDNFRIDRKGLEATRKMLKTFFVPFSLLLLWPYYSLAKGLQLIFLVCCGSALRRPEWTQFRWWHWLNLAIYGLTPAILIGMIFQMTTVPVPVAWVFYVGTAMLYTVMAARRCGSDKFRMTNVE